MREADERNHHPRMVITVLIATMATKKVIPKVAKESILISRFVWESSLAAERRSCASFGVKCGHQGGGSSDRLGDVRSLDVEAGKRRFDHGLGRAGSKDREEVFRRRSIQSISHADLILVYPTDLGFLFGGFHAQYFLCNSGIGRNKSSCTSYGHRSS